MSLEPATSGKVVLATSFGDVEIELWAQQAPKACRNFIQLCLEDYFDRTPFHRVVPGFLVQAGDRSGSGQGGESVFGKPFPDEFNSRLRFSHRGIVACANLEKNKNLSQFFITLCASPELNGKHSIFGKVVGETIFNVIRMSEVHTQGDVPLDPPLILSAKVLLNPFQDIVPRDIFRVKAVQKQVKHKSKGKRNFSLLSFGDAAEFSSVSGDSGAVQNSHDVLVNDSSLLDESAYSSVEFTGSVSAKGMKEMKETVTGTENTAQIDNYSEGNAKVNQNEDYEQIKKQFMNMVSSQTLDTVSSEKPVSAVEQRRQKYLAKRNLADKRVREQNTLEKLAQFKATLQKSDQEWKTHKLEFVKRPQDFIPDQMQREESLDDYIVIDPKKQRRK